MPGKFIQVSVIIDMISIRTFPIITFFDLEITLSYVRNTVVNRRFVDVFNIAQESSCKVETEIN